MLTNVSMSCISLLHTAVVQADHYCRGIAGSLQPLFEGNRARELTDLLSFLLFGHDDGSVKSWALGRKYAWLKRKEGGDDVS